ncbi:hypothetical protein C436_18901, partial [Haloarcula marismortui ATCC 33800]
LLSLRFLFHEIADFWCFVVYLFDHPLPLSSRFHIAHGVWGFDLVSLKITNNPLRTTLVLVKDVDADEISSRVNNSGNDDPHVIELLDHEQSALVSSVRDSCRGSSSLLHP